MTRGNHAEEKRADECENEASEIDPRIDGDFKVAVEPVPAVQCAQKQARADEARRTADEGDDYGFSQQLLHDAATR